MKREKIKAAFCVRRQASDLNDQDKKTSPSIISPGSATCPLFTVVLHPFIPCEALLATIKLFGSCVITVYHSLYPISWQINYAPAISPFVDSATLFIAATYYLEHMPQVKYWAISSPSSSRVRHHMLFTISLTVRSVRFELILHYIICRILSYSRVREHGTQWRWRVRPSRKRLHRDTHAQSVSRSPLCLRLASLLCDRARLLLFISLF